MEILCAVAALALALPVAAQGYPAKPIRFVVPDLAGPLDTKVDR